MSLRDRFKRFREDAERNRAAENARRVAEGECDQIGCSRDADRDGKSAGRWAAIFGGVV